MGLRKNLAMNGRGEKALLGGFSAWAIRGGNGFHAASEQLRSHLKLAAAAGVPPNSTPRSRTHQLPTQMKKRPKGRLFSLAVLLEPYFGLMVMVSPMLLTGASTPEPRCRSLAANRAFLLSAAFLRYFSCSSGLAAF